MAAARGPRSRGPGGAWGPWAQGLGPGPGEWDPRARDPGPGTPAPLDPGPGSEELQTRTTNKNMPYVYDPLPCSRLAGNLTLEQASWADLRVQGPAVLEGV